MCWFYDEFVYIFFYNVYSKNTSNKIEILNNYQFSNMPSYHYELKNFNFKNFFYSFNKNILKPNNYTLFIDMIEIIGKRNFRLEL